MQSPLLHCVQSVCEDDKDNGAYNDAMLGLFGQSLNANGPDLT
jgi:hypothetical protein